MHEQLASKQSATEMAHKSLGSSLGSIAEEDDRDEIVLTKFSALPADPNPTPAVKTNSQKQQQQPTNVSHSRGTTDSTNSSGKSQTKSSHKTQFATGSGNKLDHLKNKLWTIAKHQNDDFLKRQQQQQQHQVPVEGGGQAGPREQQQQLDYRHSFQIVWTQLSFEVELSTYDKLITGLLEGVRKVCGFDGRSRIRRQSPRTAQSQLHQQRQQPQQQQHQVDNYANTLANKAVRPFELSTSTVSSMPTTKTSLNSSLASSSVSLGSASASDITNKRVIFENLNGYVTSGEITAILGPSGSGKTSLLNAICGRTKNYSGRIELIGAVASKHKRMRLSIIPQKDYLIENLTVRENLLYSSRILNVRDNFDHEANIERVVKMLNLTACFNSIASNISGGEYKRVSIGQELLRQPDILVLDEPTSGLDSLNCKKLIRSLAQLIEASRQGHIKPIAILMTIHQPDVDIFNMFDHVYCMARGGRIIYDGHPRNAMQTIRYHAGFMGSGRHHQHQQQGQQEPPVPPPQVPAEGEDDLNEMLMSTTNPANLLIEIASEDLYGQEPIDRLARYQRKQFEQLMLVLASKAGSQDSGAAQVSQLQANLLSANELATAAAAAAATDQNKLPANSSFNMIKRMDNSAIDDTSSRGQQKTALAITPPYSLSTASLASSHDSRPSSSGRPPGPLDDSGTRRARYHRRHLVRDKRLNAKYDHSGLFWYHTNVLAQRAFVSTIRDPLMTLISILFHMSIPFVMWTVYPKRIGSINACPVIQRDLDIVSMASNRTAAKLEDLQEQLTTSFECSTMFFLTTYSFSMCSLTVASLAFPLNMHILLKEVRNGWYQLPSYVIAKTIANFPFEVLFPVASLVMIYLMLGMPSSHWEWRLWSMALVMAFVSMISNTQGLIFGALCMDSVQTAIFLASASSLPQTLLSGFTARIKYMPIWLQNISWLSQYRYSSDLINMIRYGFGICPCDSSTSEYLRTHPPDFKDIPSHLKPVFIYYIAQNVTTAQDELAASNATTTTFTSVAANYTTTLATVGSNSTDHLVDTTTMASSMGSLMNETMANGRVANESSTSWSSTLLDTVSSRIPGVDYELMLNDSERAQLIKRMESSDIDLFGQMADMMGRSFTYGRKLDDCQSVRSQLLVTAGTPTDDYLPMMFGCMFALLVACKLILFLVVRYKIGSRV